MENANIVQSSSSYSQETSEPKQCWICYVTDDDDYGSNRVWVSPCKCRGSTQWVHQDCVQHWVDLRLRENIYYRPCCPHCQT